MMYLMLYSNIVRHGCFDPEHPFGGDSAHGLFQIFVAFKFYLGMNQQFNTYRYCKFNLLTTLHVCFFLDDAVSSSHQFNRFTFSMSSWIFCVIFSCLFQYLFISIRKIVVSILIAPTPSQICIELSSVAVEFKTVSVLAPYQRQHVAFQHQSISMCVVIVEF